MPVDELQKEIETFCEKLFHVLDSLGLLPQRLNARPTEFEKYPRWLLAHIKRYSNVGLGFEEWKTKVLRSARLFREKQYEDRVPELLALRDWMQQHRDLFLSKLQMQHLRSSIYGRMIEYIYPRRILRNAYIRKHQGNPGAIECEFLTREFPSSVTDIVQKVQASFSGDWEQVIADTRADLERNANYYRSWLLGKLPEEIVPQEGEIELIRYEEEENV
jgi:hypothetical protein